MGMAWINISISFLLPASSTTSLLEVTIQCMAALSLAVAAKTLQPVVQGLELLQVSFSDDFNDDNFEFQNARTDTFVAFRDSLSGRLQAASWLQQFQYLVDSS